MRESYYYGSYYLTALGIGILYPSLKLELITIYRVSVSENMMVIEQL